MSDDAKPEGGGFSLRRWSTRKHAAVRGDTESRPADALRATSPEAATAPAVAAAAPAAPFPAPVPADPRADSRVATTSAAASPAADVAAKVSLPSIDSLTPQSDFTPFMRPDVEPALRRAALRRLFADPHFNVMDGLDVYIDDYSKPDPIPPDILKQLRHARYIFAPPPTRVNAEGFVEDVPEDELAKAQPAPPPVEPVAPTPLALPDGSDDVAGPRDESFQIALPLDVPQDATE